MRFLTSFVLLCLFLWLLPLGAFIKPSQEKIACDGHRAFHMCSMMMGKIDPNPSPEVKFSSGGEQRTAKSSAAGGDDFIPVRFFNDFSEVEQVSVEFCRIFVSPIVSLSIDHPPKAVLF